MMKSSPTLTEGTNPRDPTSAAPPSLFIRTESASKILQR